MFIVLGLAGVEGAGKSTLAGELRELGIEHLSTSKLLEEAAEQDGFVPADSGRDRYLPFWHYNSRIHGENWLSRLALSRMAALQKNVVLEGVRIPADATTILGAKGHMFWLDAPLPLAAKRVIQRKRDIDQEVTTVESYVERMQTQLDNTGKFALGAVKMRCTRIMPAAPDIEDPVTRAAHYRAMAWHVMDCISAEPGAILPAQDVA